jgi:uncharacterized protein (TIRG00374 family)
MKRALQIAFSLALSAFFVWLSLRKTNLAEVAGAIAGADLRYVGLSLLMLTVIHVLRTWRWGLLLQPLAKVRFRDVNPLAAVGFMALMLLPLRLGELARPYLAAEHLKLRKSAALASVVVERIVDGLFMGLVLVVLLWTLGPEVPREHLGRLRLGGALVTLAFGVGLVALVLAFRHRARADALLRSLLGRFSPRLADRVASMLAAFIDALAVVPSPARIVEFFVLTCVYWFCSGLGSLVLAPAFGFSLTLVQAFTVLGLQVIGSMIPAGPGMVGTLQAFTCLGLGLFLTGPENATRAAAFAHTAWALGFAQQVVFGLFFVLNGRVPLNHLLGRLGRGEVSSAEDTAPAVRP